MHGTALEWRGGHGTVRLEPWGRETEDLDSTGTPQQRKLAWEWVRGLLQPSVMIHVTSLNYYLPTRPAVTAQVLKDGPEYQVFAREAAGARSRTSEYGASYPKVSQAVWTAIQAAITGTATPAAALAQAQSTISGIPRVANG